MKICVVGAGAIGGYMGVELSLAGEDVTLIARGEHLDAIVRNGLRLELADGTSRTATDLTAYDAMSDAGTHDVVILALKAQQIETVAAQLGHLYHDDTVVVTVQNGIPWWYFHKHGGPYDGHRLKALDPHGTLDKSIPFERILGCIAYPAAEKAAPGVIRHVEGNRFPLGELDGSKSDRVKQLADVFSTAGFKSRVVADIRAQIWLKAWGNMTFNPISALTHATLAQICRFPETRGLAESMMTEAQTLAEKLGVTFRYTIEQRIAGAEAVGEHKTSMLQDLEAGRPLETEALIGVVAELGRLTETPTPSIDAVYACVKLLGEGQAP